MLPLHDSSTQFHSIPLPLNTHIAFPLLLDTVPRLSSPSRVNSELIRCRSSRIDTMLFPCHSMRLLSSTLRHISFPMLCATLHNRAFPLQFFFFLRNSVASLFCASRFVAVAFPTHEILPSEIFIKQHINVFRFFLCQRYAFRHFHMVG